MVEGASIYLPDETVRYGPDEQNNILGSVTWSTEIPGGFGPAEMTVPRPANLHKDDQLLYADVRLYGPGNRTLYEGYITGVPQSDNDFVTVQMAGHSTLLARIKTFRQIIIDRDLGRWNVSPSPTRQAALLTATFTGPDTGPDTAWDTDSAETTLKLQLSKGEVNPFREVYYDAGPGCEIASIDYEMTSVSVSGESALIGTADDTAASGADSSADLLTGTDSTASGTFEPATPQRFARLVMNFTGTMTDEHFTRWTLTVIGNHGLDVTDGQVSSGDVVRYLTGLSPLAAGDIDTGTTIRHLTFLDDTDLQSALEQTTVFGGSQTVRNEWGVYENKQLFWQPPGSYGKTWHARKENTATSKSDGPDVDRRVTGIKVIYQDVDGTTLSAGPVGSNSDYETDQLLDVDTLNPAYRVPGMFDTVEAGTLPRDADGTPTAAIDIGIVALNTRNRLNWRGSITVAGQVEDENGVPHPVALVRAGDRIVIDDMSSEELPINSTDYNDTDESLTVNVGAAADELEDFLAQIAAATGLVLS